MTCVRTAVIGFGNMGTAHATCIFEGKVEGMKLAAVCDIDPQRIAAAKEAFGDIPCYESWEELIAGDVCDAVVVAVPHPLHAAVGAAAMRAGKHVLCEKPMDVSISKAKEMVKAQEETGVVFSMMLNQRTNPLFQKAKAIIAGGELGELKRSVWIITNWYRTQHYYDSGTWRATWAGEGGGVLLNQAPHNMDLWQWICGMPVTVTAMCDIAKYHKIEVEDDATIIVRFANGATGTFITSTGEYPGTNRLEISGTKGKLVLEGGTMKWWKLETPEDVVRFESTENFARIPCTVEEVQPEGKETAHQGILQNFTNAILHGEPLLAPGKDGLCELTISNAAYLSAWQGSIPVQLPLDEEKFDAMLAEKAEKSAFHTKTNTGKTPDGKYSERWQVNW